MCGGPRVGWWSWCRDVEMGTGRVESWTARPALQFSGSEDTNSRRDVNNKPSKLGIHFLVSKMRLL